MAIFNTTFYSNAIGRYTQLTAIIPIDYMENSLLPQTPPKQEPFKTLVLLHGKSGTHSCWLNRSKIEDYSRKHNIAILCPSGENSFYIDDEKRQALYEKLVCEEVLSFARKVFPLSDKREDTSIGGLSMGGYGAIRNGLKHSETFGNIIALSTAFITDNLAQGGDESTRAIAKEAYFEHTFGKKSEILNTDLDTKYLAKKLVDENKSIPNIYMACGREDFLYNHNCDYSEYLTQINVEHTYAQDNGIHDWNFWDKYIEKAIEWLIAQ